MAASAATVRVPVVTRKIAASSQSDGPECPANSIPSRGSSRHRTGVAIAATAAVTGIAATPARARTATARASDRKPFRRTLACATLTSCTSPPPDRPPTSPRRVILSVRVPTSQPPERPGQILREEFIKTGRLTQAALAQRMNVPVSKVRGISSGEEGITAETALLLEAALGVEAEFWIRAQFVWDCYRLREVERRTAVLEHEVKGSGKRPKSS